MDDLEYVGSSIFGKIKSDPNVTPNLKVCLYCKVSQSGHRGKNAEGSSWHKDIDYKIPLNSVMGGCN